MSYRGEAIGGSAPVRSNALPWLLSYCRAGAHRCQTLAGNAIGPATIACEQTSSSQSGEDAERFDVARANTRRHLGFGHGIHRCVGARLAEIQLATLIGEIVARNWRIVPQDPAERLASPFLHGFVHMPVRIERR